MNGHVVQYPRAVACPSDGHGADEPALTAEHPTVSSYYVRQIMRGLRLLGHDLHDVLLSHDIQEEQLEDPLFRVPIEVERGLFRTGLKRTGDPLLGLHIGQQFSPCSMGPLGYAAMSSATLGEAMELVLHHELFRTEIASCDVAYLPDRYVLTWMPRFEDEEFHRHRVELTFASWGRYTQACVAEIVQPSVTIHFRHDRQTGLDDYVRELNADVRFGQTADAIIGPLEALEVPLASANREIHLVAKRQVAAIASSHDAKRGFLQMVRHAISDLLHEGTPKLEAVSVRLEVPAWKLQRMLKLEGMTFAELVEHQRQMLAARYLNDSRYTIGDVVSALGYSEQSAFNRAFRRWYGCTPVEFRARASFSTAVVTSRLVK